jgi:hypothetical protein
LPAPEGAAFGGAVGQVGAVGGGAAVAHHLTRDHRGQAIDEPGDLRVGEAVGQAQRAICWRSCWMGLPLGIAVSFVLPDAPLIAFTSKLLQRIDHWLLH